MFSLDNGNTITNPYDIAKTFNNYFGSIAETTKNNIKHSHKHLKNDCDSITFLQPISIEGIAEIIFSLNSNKDSGPNDIAYTTLFFLKNEILKQLADLLNLSFVVGIFPLVLKTAKVVPVFKKESKLDYSNYRSMSFKIFGKPMYKGLYTFLNNKNTICNFQFCFRQYYSTSHVFINITENIRRALDEGNVGCGVFVDL